MKNKNIAILGAGWLGLPLIEHLVTLGHNVRASYRREANRADIIEVGGEPYLLDLPDLDGPLGAFLLDVDALVITLPPHGRSLGDRTTEVYLSALNALKGMLTDLHVVYTSSTGVYGTATGRVDETTAPSPDTNSSKAVVAAEEWLSQQTKRLTLLRLAGLFGPGRDPSSFFRQRDVIPNGDAPVNMVHRHDVLRAIQLVLDEQLYGTFNVCAQTHPTKRAFYTSHLRQAGLPQKDFLEGGADGKVIDSAKIRQAGWSPRHDELS
jgi:nucleoside-diphosphate-sugar epimerase